MSDLERKIKEGLEEIGYLNKFKEITCLIFGMCTYAAFENLDKPSYWPLLAGLGAGIALYSYLSKKENKKERDLNNLFLSYIRDEKRTD